MCELKKTAREQLCGKWGAAALFTFVYVILSAIIATPESFVWNLSLLSSLLIAPMDYSYNIAFLSNKRVGESFSVEQLFVGYKDFLRIAGTNLLVQIYISLWMLLLVVPGIIKGISYSQTVYILNDNPELAYDAAIERSMAMMEGHKWEYFCLYLSFIGWILLIIITAGIATFWVLPYMCATFANFYEKVKGEYEKR